LRRERSRCPLGGSAGACEAFLVAKGALGCGDWARNLQAPMDETRNERKRRAAKCWIERRP
jgi:hypothetical protein